MPVLTKPVREMTGDERAAFFRATVRAILTGLPTDTGKLRSYQVAYAKGRAVKQLLSLGF
jgi:hypothetical protein